MDSGSPNRLLERLNAAWGWTGLAGIEILGRNEFGNFLIRDAQGKVWRVCPEELQCEVVALDATAYAALLADEEFQLDWQLEAVVEIARNHLGPLSPGSAYYLVIPGTFGGAYDETNIRVAPLDELILHSGSWAEQIKDLPEGAEIKLRVVD